MSPYYGRNFFSSTFSVDYSKLIASQLIGCCCSTHQVSKLFKVFKGAKVSLTLLILNLRNLHENWRGRVGDQCSNFLTILLWICKEALTFGSFFSARQDQTASRFAKVPNFGKRWPYLEWKVVLRCRQNLLVVFGYEVPFVDDLSAIATFFSKIEPV